MARPNYTGAIPPEDADLASSVEGGSKIPVPPLVEPGGDPGKTIERPPDGGLPAEQPGGGALATPEESWRPPKPVFAVEGATGDPEYLRTLLATKKTQPKMDFSGSITLIYGPPKIGKSELASQYPTPFFIATEEGHSHLQIYKTSVTSWQHFLDVVQALVVYHDSVPYKTIVVDTVDLLLDFCFTHYTQEAGVTYPSEEPFGKGWDSLRRTWQKGIYALIKLGYTVVFISHAKVRKVTIHNIERDVITPSLGTTGSKVVMPTVDYIVYLDYGPREETKDGRWMVLRGDSSIEAGDRSGFFPSRLPEVSYKALHDAYVKYVIPGLEAKYKKGR